MEAVWYVWPVEELFPFCKILIELEYGNCTFLFEIGNYKHNDW